MVKKIIIFIVIILIGIGGYFAWNRFYYDKIFNYKRVIKESMNEYYKTNDSTKLEAISKVFEIYSYSEDKKYDLQNEIYLIYKDWIDYQKSKYMCNLDSVNVCKIYSNELKDIDLKLDKIYRYRSYPLINKNRYTLLKKDLKKTMGEVELIIIDPQAKRDRTYEEERLYYCSMVEADDCTCKNGICACVYEKGTFKKNLTCRDIYTPEEKK